MGQNYSILHYTTVYKELGSTCVCVLVRIEDRKKQYKIPCLEETQATVKVSNCLFYHMETILHVSNKSCVNHTQTTGKFSSDKMDLEAWLFIIFRRNQTLQFRQYKYLKRLFLSTETSYSWLHQVATRVEEFVLEENNTVHCCLIK